MPPARSASASARSASARSASARSASASPAPRRQPRATPRPVRPPRSIVLRSPKLRVRWERVGRYGLLLVLVVVVGLYVEHTLSYVSTRTQSDQQNAIVNRLTHQNKALAQQLRSLNDPVTIVRDARALGMVRPGEKSYAMIGQSQR